MRILLLSLLLLVPCMVVPNSLQVEKETSEEILVQLVVIGPGNLLHTWFGHIGLRVLTEDRDLFYEMGVFNMGTLGFYLNFLKGRLIFYSDIVSTVPMLNHYAEEPRSVRIHTLNLSVQAKRDLLTHIERDVLPENREYLYDHYLDNCSTGIRDILDKAVGGQISREMAPVMLRDSFRSAANRYIQRSRPLLWLLELLQGSAIDRKMSRWEAMFLPESLEKILLTWRYTDDTGERVPLIEESTTYRITEQGNPITQSERETPLWYWSLSLGLLIAILSLLCREYDRPFGIFQKMIILPMGFLGAFMTLVLFGENISGRGNLNLFLYHPLLLLALPWAFALTKGGNPKRPSARNRILLRLTWDVQLILALVLIGLKGFSSIEQDNAAVLAITLPTIFSLGSPGNLVLAGVKGLFSRRVLPDQGKHLPPS